MVRESITFIMASLVVFGCAPQNHFEQKENTVIVSPETGPARRVRLEVINERTIGVTASATDTFSSSEGLMVLPQPAFSDFTIKESDEKIVVSTKRVTAEVHRKTGEVTFLDGEGNIILREQEGGGKTMTPIQVEGQPAWYISQAFESPDDEAFYGLGGHQNGQMNYKNEDVELAQHNIVAVVPFLYSNRNYGLLWDNYSISWFGDPRPYEPISSLQLFDRNGNPGGLTAEYYVGDKVVRAAVESEINYEFLETPQVDNFPKDVANGGKVVWEGSFTSDKGGSHKFLLYSSGYFKVWLDGELIMDKWRQNWNPWTNKFQVDIEPGQKHSIRIEWIGQGGYMALKHLDPWPREEQQKLRLTSEVGDQIAYYFIQGDDADEVISGYRTLTGKAPIVPKWAMGFWQSRERYRSQEELIGVVREYRKRRIPIDNIVLDWQYWEDPKWGSHEFDSARFPDPRGMVARLHDELDARIMISVWPKFNLGTKHYNEMNERGFLFTRNIEMGRKDWVGVGYQSTFYDPFNPEAGEMFWNQIDGKLNNLGFDAWWLDATEPDMHSNLSLNERKKNMSPTAMGPGAKYFNAYSLMNSKSVYEGQRKSSPDKRVFILTRSAYGGQQRYGAVTWSGDIVSRWSDFYDQISTGVNFSLSGIPYWTMDIGGFAVESRYYNASGETLDEWRELNARWFQFGAFCPIFRSHGQYPFREIFHIAPEGHEIYRSMVYYDKLRYRLLPYLYSLAGQTWLNDYTIMRGLIMDFPDDQAVTDIADQYMFGPAFLVSPVYEYKSRSREVYLPAGEGWYDFYTGKFLKGGQRVVASAPLDRMPVHVRAGSIVSIGPDMKHTNEKPADPITLYVYTGRDCDFLFYEDEGVNYDYEQGAYATITLSYDESTATLTIGARQGGFDGMLQERDFHIVWVSPDRPVGEGQGTKPDATVRYRGEQIAISMNR